MLKVKESGYFEYPAGILEDEYLDGKSTLTCVALWYFKAKGNDTPTLNELATITGLTNVTVLRALEILEEAFWIKREKIKIDGVKGLRIKYTLFESPEYPEIEQGKLQRVNRPVNALRRKQFGRNVR